jgi:hypothetical protein
MNTEYQKEQQIVSSKEICRLINIHFYTFEIPLLFITDTSRTYRIPENVRVHINENGPTTEKLNIQIS